MWTMCAGTACPRGEGRIGFTSSKYPLHGVAQSKRLMISMKLEERANVSRQSTQYESQSVSVLGRDYIKDIRRRASWTALAHVLHGPPSEPRWTNCPEEFRWNYMLSVFL